MARLGVTQIPPAGSSSRLFEEPASPRIDHISDGLEEVGKQGSGAWSGDKQLIPSGKEDRTVPLGCSAPLSRSGVRVSGADRLRRRRSGAGVTTVRGSRGRANMGTSQGMSLPRRSAALDFTETRVLQAVE